MNNPRRPASADFLPGAPPYCMPVKYAIQHWTLLFWISLCAALTFAGLYYANAPEKRHLFSDQGSHISAALSLWYDHDFEYTLGDLARFREAMPAESGPRGAFLKVGSDGGLYYAKPYLYALAAAPFVGLFGLDGFFILNMLCFMAIGVVTISVLEQHLNQMMLSFLLIGLYVFSPFMAWTSVAHPDLFIAALLAVSGFLLLKSGGLSALRVVGGLLLGLVIYEKMFFAVFVPFIFLANFRAYRLHLAVIVAMAILIGWIAPTAIHLLQDGQWSAYKGIRFWILGTGGNFPLESGWKAPTVDGITEHVFRLGEAVRVLISNIPLLPEKILDSAIGRQTGLIPYFPVAVFLFGLLLMRITWRSTFILCGLFAYLSLNWLAFPTNGYGGGGTYGPRYTMQALILLPLAFLVARIPSKKQSSNVSVIAFGFLAVFVSLAVFLHGSLVPPSQAAVANPGNFLMAPSASVFPMERSLLPSVSQNLPSTFAITSIRSNFLYKISGRPSSFGVFLEEAVSDHEVIAYQIGPKQAFDAIGLSATCNTEVSIMSSSAAPTAINVVSVSPGPTVWTHVDVPFHRSYNDLLSGSEVRWSSLVLHSRVMDAADHGVPCILRLNLGDPMESSGPLALNTKLMPSDFGRSGIEAYGWHAPEIWGAWSAGDYSSLFIPLTDDVESWELQFQVRAYTPIEAPKLAVEILIQDKLKETWHFFYGEGGKDRIIAGKPRMFGNRKGILIGFRIRDPRSPMALKRGLDSRELGLGLDSLTLSVDVK